MIYVTLEETGWGYLFNLYFILSFPNFFPFIKIKWLFKKCAKLYRNQHPLPQFCASGTIVMSLSPHHMFKLTPSGHNNKSSQRGPSGKTSYFLGSYFPGKKNKIKTNKV